MSILGIDHVQLAAPQGCEDEARRFFGGVLGLREIEKPPSLAARGGVWFGAGEQQIHIGIEGRFVPAKRPIRRCSSRPLGSRRWQGAWRRTERSLAGMTSSPPCGVSTRRTPGGTGSS
jgi:catechol 2,3-dioxygenase-like lactoylglutathione lyase family enzyme